MSIQLTVPPRKELKPRITVIGVGGAGGNAVNNMIKAGLEGVDFVVANTDAQALAGSHAERRIQMGAQLTEGLGAGSDPSIGSQAAEEAMAEIVDQIQGSHMVFVTAGMGGGTGTGAAPIIARACREQGILTIGVVTKPFEFEGPRRMRAADAGIEELTRAVDTLIIIPNQNLFRVANEQTGFVEAFAIADEVLHSGVSSVTDLMTKPGLINLDFADVKMVMNEMGKAMMGTGEGQGENRAIEAAEAAIANPLLEDDSMQGATGVLINITGGEDMTLYEVDEAANRIKREVYSDANIIIGAIFDESLEGIMRVSVVATGIASDDVEQEVDTTPRVVHLATPTPDIDALSPEPAAQATGEAEMAPMPAAPQVGAEAGQGVDEAEAKPDMPDFLAPPVRPQPGLLPRRKQSFIDRVLRGRKEEDDPKAQQKPAEESSAASMDAPPAQETPPVPEAAPESVEESYQPHQPITGDEAMPLDFEDTPESKPAVAETDSTPSMGDTAQASQAEQGDLPELVEVVLDEDKEPSRLVPETTAQAPVPQIEAEAEPQAEAEISQAADESVAVSDVAESTQPMQTTMQSSPSSGGLDDAQLDIPAFLRRN